MGTDRNNLRGRVVLITGGSRGLGAEMAWAFAEEGADIVVASRKEQPCIDLAAEIAARTGVETMGIGAHVGDWDAMPALVDAVYERFGHLDVLINNAGIAPLYPSLGEISQELFDKIIAVNLKGPFRLGALVAERMKSAGHGTIVNISSNASERPAPEYVPYGAAKAGLNSLTKGLAATYGPEVRVNTIMAGAFFTDISKGWDTQAFDELASSWPIPRGGNPSEIVGAALYFAGDASSFTTGTILPVDGGRMAVG
ncbi:glucose 1-dehydrogenase [Rhodococcus sp. 14C212]|uniref:SDR family NAD(P)-dependent oxidoreductase n=1 Tax=Rhodococcus sp. 14C212 TaxID=2711209 RepID=UPI0013ECE607|nr:glucose 1-dehydrogenase [Rhodococcus sp. 14C212]NGP08694.1 glucose 1-dehydrogenase [Rhodococcus sp. 14C212]